MTHLVQWTRNYILNHKETRRNERESKGDGGWYNLSHMILRASAKYQLDRGVQQIVPKRGYCYYFCGSKKLAVYLFAVYCVSNLIRRVSLIEHSFSMLTFARRFEPSI